MHRFTDSFEPNYFHFVPGFRTQKQITASNPDAVILGELKLKLLNLVLFCLSMKKINLCFYSKFIIQAVIHQPVQSARENACSLSRKQESRQGLNAVNLPFDQLDLLQSKKKKKQVKK